MQKILMGVAAIALSVFGGMVVSQGAMAYTCPAGSLRGEGTPVSTPADCNVEETKTGLMETVKTILNIVLTLVGLIAVVIIIIGGINFITSQGDAAKVARAKNTVLYGVIGLIIALLAFAIVNFVLSGVFGSSTD